MELKECTKDELIFIIKRLTWLDDFHLRRLLNEVEYERVKKKLAEAEHWNQVADDCRKKHYEILKKYEGIKLIDIPIGEIKKADQWLKNAKKADEKHIKLMKEVDAYGKNR